MALLFMDGFDANDIALKWYNPVGASTSGTTRFGSGLSLNLFSNGVSVTKWLLSSPSQVFVGYAQLLSGSTSAGGVVLQGDNGNTSNISVILTLSGVFLHAGNNGATLASWSNPNSTNTWYYIEFMATLASSGGQCKVRVNGVQVINFTGNTLQGGTGTTIDRIVPAGYTGGQGVLFDDLYVCDATGATNNTFLGDVRVQTLFPNGVGSSTQFSPTGSANNYANVNDVPDSTATYNSSSTVGQRDTYAMGDTLASTGTVFGIQDNIHAFKTNSGAANIKAAINSGGTIAYDTTQVLDASNTWSGAIRETDPNTGLAWTPPNVNNVEFGAEVA